jgi:anti-sigma B factor antagonist
MASLEGSSGASLEISTTVDAHGVLSIAPAGDVDLSNAAQLAEAVSAAVERRPHRLVFDLADLSFIDSAGIAVLVTATNALKDVHIRNPSPIVSRVIELTGLAEVLPTEPQ